MNYKRRKYSLLIVDDDKYVREVLAEALTKPEFDVSTASSGEQAITILNKKKFDLVLSDLKMKKIDGLELLKHIKTSSRDTDVVIITAYGTVETAVKALKLGAYDYILKPIEVSKLRNLVKHILDHRQLQIENIELKRQLEQSILPENILGNNSQTIRVREVIKQIAGSHVTVLIEGESGTGKELVARSIHNLSHRRHKPFVTINCGALPPTLFESELFGHEKGAFTGALYQRKGRFEIAHQGTLFLDEIAEISLESQVNFLRVLEDSRIRRVGGDEEFSVDVRVIAATNKNLKKHLATGEFREDLFYRLNVINIQVSPLRNRKEDIPLLAKSFLQEFSVRHKIPKKTLSPEVQKAFLNYHWPGNVRELRNFLERALLLSTGKSITPDLFSFEEPKIRDDAKDQIYIPFGTSAKEAEKELILSTLSHVKGHRKNAAHILGISVRSLQYRLKEYQKHDERFQTL
ncbi:sigma-54-dependent transcriptional regulator [candidate division CSSED10-310 bacterium]|uniref:Sigma-54-dependent transcriptional regulator n=1 Tax=candidate division CSSED10-310 bacterium TaxID=2855610 RepID=A0ABV6YRI7_UNCC1